MYPNDQQFDIKPNCVIFIMCCQNFFIRYYHRAKIICFRNMNKKILFIGCNLIYLR